MSEQGPHKPKRRRRGLRILSSVLGLLVVLLSAAVALLPYAIEQGTRHWLAHQGIDQTRVENIDFNPFTGTLYVRGLRAVADGITVLAAPEFGFTFEWRPLLDGELKVDRIHLRGLEVLVSRAEHGVTVAGMVLGGPAAGGGTTPAGWQLEVDDWEVTDSVVTYRAHDVDTIFRADRWRIDDLSTEPDGRPTRVRFEGSINHAPLAFDAELTPFARSPGWRGHVELKALELGPLGPAFSAPIAELNGQVSAEGETTVEVAGEDGIRFDYLGVVALQGINARGETGDRATLDGFHWEGSLGVETGGTTRIGGEGELRLGRLEAIRPEADLETRIDALSGPFEFEFRSPAESGPGIALNASGELAAERVEVATPAAGVSVVNEAPSWSGDLTLDDPEGEGNPLRLDVTGELGAERVAVDVAGEEEIHVVHDGMAWTGKVAVTGSAKTTRLDLDGALRGEEVRVDVPGQGVQVQHAGLTWEGRLGLGVPEGEAPVDLTVEGGLAGRSVAVRLAEQGLDLTQHRLDWSGRFALSGPEATDMLSARGRLAGDRLEVTLAEPAFESRYESTEWEGLFRLAEGADGAAPILRGRLTGGPWQVALTDAGVQVAGDGLRWREPESEPAKEQPALLRGDLGADALTVTRSGDGTRLFVSDRVDFKDLTVDSVVRAGALGLGRLAVMPRSEEGDGADLVSAASARFEGPRVGEDGTLSASLLEVRDVTTELTRKPDGSLRIGPSGGSGDTPAENDPATGDTVGNTLPVRVDRIRLAGENRLHFRDRSVEPAFETTLRLGRVDVDNLDLSRPDATTRIAVEGGIGEYTTLAVNGTVAPQARPVRLDLEGQVRELDLPPLSPYAQKELGYRITRGHMGADAKLTVDKGKLDGKNRLTFRNLTVEPAANSKTQELVAQLKMPLGQALNMLRDKQNNIEMELPVSGDITKPKFDFGDAIQQALGKTVRFAAVSYLKHALQPYGTLITMVEWAGKAADYVGAVRLDPIGFPAGDAVLDDKARDYIDHIAKLMDERPELRMNLCGHAVPADRKALTPRSGGEKEDDAEKRAAAVDEQTLLDLARRRAEKVKQRLVKRHGITAERVFICQPEFRKDQDAKPQVEPLV